MIEVNIEEIVAETTRQIENLALATASKYKEQAIEAGKKILADMKNDLARWSNMLANGALTILEFEALARSYKTEIAMSGLYQAGLAQIRAYELGVSILNTIIDVVLKLVSQIAMRVGRWSDIADGISTGAVD